MTSDEPTNRPSKRQVRLLLGGLFLLTVAAKIILFHGACGPSVFHDESINRYYARSIFWLEPYVSGVDRDPMYPPAYPLVLSPAYFAAGDGWFDAMRFINCIIGSLLPLAVYCLARHVCPGWPAVAAAAVSAFIPFHAAYCPMLLSENLAMPLFTFAFALALRPGRAGPWQAASLGLVCGAAYLTKYLFLAYAPFVAAVFLLTQWSARKDLPAGRRVFALLKLSGIAMLAAAIVVAAWLWYSLASGNGLADSLGIFLAPTTEKSTPPIEGFWFYLVLLFMGLILMLLLILPALIVFYFLLRKDRFTPAARTMGIVFATMCPLLLLFVARFCWVESLVYLPIENWKIENISHFISLRYLIYLLPLAIPLATAGIAEFSRSGATTAGGALAGRIAAAGLAVAITVCLAILARQTLFAGLIWNFPQSVAHSWVNAPDIFVFSTHWGWSAGIAACAAAVCLIAARAAKHSMIILTILAAVVYPAASAVSHDKWWTPGMRELTGQMRRICGSGGSIRSVCPDPASALFVVDVGGDKSVQHAKTFGWYAVFWADSRINVAPGIVKSDGGGINSVVIRANQRRMGVQNCRRDMVLDPSQPIRQLFVVAPDDSIIPLPLGILRLSLASPDR
ncbi:MAG: glycosyltransferase family 39 protein [Planctomycetes bacterium]|nr:glycosyltransferase family 39 protein [Planctomycetota bacterium]